MPDYTHTQLSFATGDAAVTDFKLRMSGQGISFSTPENDPSIPKDDADRQKYCRSLLGDMKDISRAQDSSSSDYKSCWAACPPGKYRHVDIETTCWEIVLSHRSVFLIMDFLLTIIDSYGEAPPGRTLRDIHPRPQLSVTIQASAHLTFQQCINVIGALMLEWKARNYGLTKGDALQSTVTAPPEAL